MMSEANIPIRGTVFKCRCYPFPDGKEDFALILDYGKKVPTVRIHSECLTGDVFGSERCDCGQQLNISLGHICKEGGILIYLRQEGRGIGLFEKLKAYSLQDENNLDTIESNIALGHPIDARSYDKAIQILKDLNVEVLYLITNNPNKVKIIEQSGIRVAKILPCHVGVTENNKKYLEAKKYKLGHTL